ncbi:restriction endonuclease subunit S [Francisella sciaenopsi]|uniref:Type I restriction modification DNA specificity domain-containing protein n=1 Tax=Francisella sciaenopsi TaxID=3055034 RepID=A0ABQ6PHR5_9GAMM
MKNNLDSREWQPYKIGKLFELSKGVYLGKKYLELGYNPYVTATTNNNGIIEFIKNKPLFPKNSITIEKVSLASFYQPKSFYCSHDVSVILSQKINKYIGLFLTTMINRQGYKYSYGRQAQLNVVKRETIFLPINKKQKPDYQFMEDYSKNLLEAKKVKYLDYNKKKLADLEYKEIEPLESKEWKEFFVKDIFTLIQRGKRLIKNAQIKGDMPYISSTASKNGVDNFLSNKESVRIFSNCITIANSGSVGASFFHPYSFVASDHVTHLKNEEFSKYIYLFVATIANRYSEKYNFNREINDARLSREKIILPITLKGQPDYQYMEQYIKNVEYKKRIKYMNFIDKK